MAEEENAVLNPSGLTDEQAQEVHSYFVKFTMIWGGIALIAHLMVWSWLPWFPT